jgi:short chain dehydrogenase
VSQPPPAPPAHVAIVTGANHGIGAATAAELAARGVAVLATYLRLDRSADPGATRAYGDQRAAGSSELEASVRRAGGVMVAAEADLADPATIPALFDRAERDLGPVDILVHNASGWLADTFKPAASDRFGRSLRPVSAGSVDRQFAVDTRADHRRGQGRRRRPAGAGPHRRARAGRRGHRVPRQRRGRAGHRQRAAAALSRPGREETTVPDELTWARAAWAGYAGVGGGFRPGRVRLEVSPSSRICPPGAAGFVVPGDAAIVTVPHHQHPGRRPGGAGPREGWNVRGTA